MSREEFRRAHLRPRRPLVLQAPAKSIAAVGTWTLDFFATHYASHRVPIDGLFSGREETIGSYVQQLRATPQGSELGSLYMRNLLLFERFPELRADFEMPWIADPNWLQSPVLGDFSGGSWRYWVELFLSGPGSRFPFVHVDPYYTHAWSLQIAGRKRFWLWEPLETQYQEFLDGTLARQDPQVITAATRLEDFFPERRSFSVVLEPGEILFVPAGWWHTTETREESVTLGGNFVEASNWKDFRRLYLARNPPHSLGQFLQRRITSMVAPAYLNYVEPVRDFFSR